MSHQTRSDIITTQVGFVATKHCRSVLQLVVYFIMMGVLLLNEKYCAFKVI
jgi:hypothetical protein